MHSVELLPTSVLPLINMFSLLLIKPQEAKRCIWFFFNIPALFTIDILNKCHKPKFGMNAKNEKSIIRGAL